MLAPSPLGDEARSNLRAVMSLRPEALRGAGAGTHVAGEVDYRLARNAVVSEFHKGGCPLQGFASRPKAR
jgi:hypothetical protein